MSVQCELCGKRPVTGNKMTTRGKAKYLGGVGTKITGLSKRLFKPNLQSVHVTVNGTNKSMRVCTRCIRTGLITKRIAARPFQLPADAKAAKAKTKTAPKAKA